MGSFFNGGSRSRPRYQRLPLDTFYLTESTDINHKELDEDNTLFELGDLGQKGPLLSTTNGYDSQEEIEFYKDTRGGRGGRRKTGCSPSLFRLVVLLILIVCVVFVLGGIYVAGSGFNNKLNEKNWSSSLFNYSTETAIRLYDVNLDGIQDIILGASPTTSLPDALGGSDYCTKNGMEYPCAGRVLALDGRDGSTLWDVGTQVEVFAIQCGKLDINGDGHMDCIVAGRMATLHGIDPIKGKRLWSADPDVTNPHFNYYQGQVVPDLNGDGVPDFVVAHGGDTRLTEEDVNRPAGRLLLLSGKTGKSLGRYVVMPDAHESYSAVTLYERANGATYILFGSGGETISGSFWAISLRDLYCHVMSIESCDALHLAEVSSLQSVGYNEPWGSPLRTLPSGIMEVLRSGSSKGVSVPTEVVDINNDGTDDLLVFMYNSTIVALDGTNLDIIWSTGQRFADYETYSNPAPGYFNDDDTLDLMVRLNKGIWGSFSEFYVFVLDGRNGETLWYLKTSTLSAVMASPLTIQSHGYKDAFILWIQGLYSNSASKETEGTDEGRHGSTAPSADDSMKVLSSDLRHRRHGDDNEEPVEQLCEKDLNIYLSELLLIDRDLAKSPLKLAEMNPTKYKYTLTEEDRQILKSDSYHHGIPPPSPNQAALPTTEEGTATAEDIARHGQLDKSTTITASTMAVTIKEGIETAATTPEGQETPTTTERAEITTGQTDRMTTVSTTTPNTTVPEEKRKIGSSGLVNRSQQMTTQVSTTEGTISRTTDYTTTEAQPHDITTTSIQQKTTELTTGIKTTVPIETTSSTSQDATTPGEEGHTSDLETTTSTTQTTQETATVTEADQSDATTVQVTTGQTLSLSRLNESDANPLLVTSANQSLDSSDTDKEKETTTEGQDSPGKLTTDSLVQTPQGDAGSSPSKQNKESVIDKNNDTTTVKQEPLEKLTTDSMITTLLGDNGTSLDQQKGENVSDGIEKREDGDTNRRRRETPGGELCTVRIPFLLSTGIIGDIDSDGNLDYIYAEAHIGQVVDERSSYIKEKISLVVRRLVLSTAIKRGEWSRVEKDKDKVFLSDKVTVGAVDREEIAEHFRFLPAEEQSWTGYMGKGGDGKFKKSKR